MSRRREKRHLNWFLPEWMATLNVRQVDLALRTGWSKTTASLIVNGKQDYTPKIVDDAAHALNISVFELFMRPDDAMSIRRLRQTALAIAADVQIKYRPEPPLESMLRTG